MKALIMDENVTVYRDVNLNEPLGEPVEAGTGVELGKKTKGTRGKAIEVLMPSGELGFIRGDTRTVPLQRVIVAQEELPVYQRPSLQSHVTQQLKKGCEFHIGDGLTNEGKKWCRILDPSGSQGFVAGDCRICMVNDIGKGVVSDLRRGVTKDRIIDALVAGGMPMEVSTKLVDEFERAPAESMNSAWQFSASSVVAKTMAAILAPIGSYVLGNGLILLVDGKPGGWFQSIIGTIVLAFSVCLWPAAFFWGLIWFLVSMGVGKAIPE